MNYHILYKTALVIFIPVLLFGQSGGRVSSPSSKASPEAQTVSYPKKTGNPYVIKGVTYYPLNDVSPDYQETGVASWYGKDFHGKKTASGEYYDMHTLTAAHKTLPLPTFINVKNLDNGKEVVVRVNDRGPFSKGRILDLSYAAAKSLGIVADGTARVTITVLSQSATNLETEGKVVDITKGRFKVQIAAFANYENAQRLAAKYAGSQIQTAELHGRTIYRVQIGGFTAKADAQKAVEEYVKDFPDSYVVAE